MSPKLLNFLLVLVPAVMYYGFIDPLYTGNPGIVLSPESSIEGLQTQNITYSQALDQVALVSRGMDQMVSDYKKIDDGFKQKVETLMPDNIDSIKLINEIMTIGNKSGLGISNVAVDTKVNDRANPGLTVYRVTFSAQAHYTDLKKLMEAFERNLRFFIPETITISRRDKKDLTDRDTTVITDEELLSGSFVFRVYFLPIK